MLNKVCWLVPSVSYKVTLWDIKRPYVTLYDTDGTSHEYAYALVVRTGSAQLLAISNGTF